ncbi:MAG: tetratricopeptide repeat protein, partial [bacterium]
ANIFVMPLEGGQMKQLTFLDSYNTGVAWSRDGKEIAFGSTQNGKAGVWRVAADGGTPRPFEDTDLSDSGFDLTWSPGANILYQAPGNQNFHVLSPVTEEKKRLVVDAEYGWMFSPRYSPDAKLVALYWNRYSAVLDRPVRSFWVVSPADTSRIELHRGPAMPIGWSADGRWIYAWNFFKKPIEIMMIPAAGGQARVIATLPFDEIEGLSMTPDGKQLVCAAAQHRSDVWVMEHFDPEYELAAPMQVRDWPEGKLLSYEQKGSSLLRQGKYAEAEPYFRQGLELNPNHLRLLSSLGSSLQNQAKYTEAEKVFRKGVDLYPEARKFFHGLGWCLLHQARYAEAEEIFLKGLELDSKYRAILNGLVQLKIEIQDYNAAIRYAERHKDAHAQFRKHGMRQLGQINLLQKNYTAAEKHLREAVLFDSTYVPPYRLLAYLFARQDRYDEALHYARKSVTMASNFADYNLMGWVLVSGEINLERGIAFAEKALAAKPENWAHTAEVYSYYAIPEHTLGLAYLKKGEYEKATQYLEQAAEFAPERQAIQDDLQRAREKLTQK